MKKWWKLIITLTLLYFLSVGCASTSTEPWIRCPKCGDFYKSKQGAEVLEELTHGRGVTRW